MLILDSRRASTPRSADRSPAERPFRCRSASSRVRRRSARLQPVDLALHGRTLALAAQPLKLHGATRPQAPGTRCRPRCRSPAAPPQYLDAARSAEGNVVCGLTRAAISRHFQDPPRPTASPDPRPRDLPSASRAPSSVVDQTPKSAPFRPVAAARSSAARAPVSVVPPLDGRLPDLRADHLFGNPRLVRQPIGELVAGRGVRNPGGDRQHPVQELPPAVVAAEVVPAAARSSRYSRYGREAFSCSMIRRRAAAAG